MIKILIVDDHTIFRQCIVWQIRSLNGYEVVGETGSGVSAVRLARELAPQVVIMDISLPDMDGIEATRRIRQQDTGCKVILLSMHRYSQMLNHFDEIGIDAYVLKDDAFEDLLYAIKAVNEGRRYVSPSLLKGVSPMPITPAFHQARLTKREGEILALIAEGLTSREIAGHLRISVKTVETYRARLMEKLGVKNVAELVKCAIKLGIVKI